MPKKENNSEFIREEGGSAERAEECASCTQGEEACIDIQAGQRGEGRSGKGRNRRKHVYGYFLDACVMKPPKGAEEMYNKLRRCPA